MRFFVLALGIILSQNILAIEYSCDDFANHEQEGVNNYLIAKMRNPTAPDSLVFLHYDMELDADYFAKKEIYEKTADILGFEKAFNVLANNNNEFLIKKYSNMMGFARASQYFSLPVKPGLSIFLLELRKKTMVRCESVVKTGELKNSFEALMVFLIKKKLDNKEM